MTVKELILKLQEIEDQDSIVCLYGDITGILTEANFVTEPEITDYFNEEKGIKQGKTIVIN